MNSGSYYRFSESLFFQLRDLVDRLSMECGDLSPLLIYVMQ
jgi:hypothetical protein